MKILFIGADVETVESVGDYLDHRWPGTKTAQKANVQESLDLIDGTSPDAALFYANFPDIETSATAIQQLRAVSNIPFMVLSPQRGEQEVVTALHFGADDYIKLPCDPPELMARIESLLRRAGSIIRQHADQPIFRSSLVLNPAAKEVLIGNQSIKLAATQFKLLNQVLIAPITEALSDGSEFRSGLGLGLQSKDRTGPLEKYARQVAEMNGRQAQESSEAAHKIERLFLDAP